MKRPSLLQLSTLVIFVKCFNLEEREEAVNTFSFNRLSLNESFTFGGVNFAVSTTSQRIRITAGIVESKDSTRNTGAGVIASCEASVENHTEISSDWLSDSTCRVDVTEALLTMGINHKTRDDQLGATILVRNGATSPQHVVCAPGRKKSCGVTGTYVPGACYYGPLNDSISLLEGWGEILVDPVAACFESFLDVVFLIDSSSSINSLDFKTMKEILIDVSEVFSASISSTTQIGILQYFHRSMEKEGILVSNLKYVRPARLGSCRDTDCLQNAIRENLTFLNSPDTFTATAIEEAIDVDFYNSRNRDVARKILILITDGRTSSEDQNKLLPSYDLTRRNGITVYAIGVGSNVDREQLKISANGGVSDERVLTTENYGSLRRHLKNLTMEISRISAEETGNETMTLENAQIGTSGNFAGRTEELFLGAVGAYYWSGTVIRYESPSSQTAQVLNFTSVQSLLGNNSENSYLGYAISSGYYEGGEDLYVAVSAPRHRFIGAVVIIPSDLDDSGIITRSRVIEPQENPNIPRPNSQLGSYFGGSLLSLDINGDGKDDLLIGCPLFTADNYDEGRVFVYVSDSASTSTITKWVGLSYLPQALYGDGSSGGRFGAAMTSAGDLNDDGYNDVIIGAPYNNGGKGAIFLYGGSRSGFDAASLQKISASSFHGTPIYSFGYSLQGGVDVDGNSYPDLFVGAPQSDVVVLFRARPIVKINVSLFYDVTDINVFSCFSQPIRSCLKVHACFQARGTQPGEEIGVSFNISVDSALKRVEFRQNANLSSTGFSTLREDVLIVSSRNACVVYQLYVKNKVEDYSTPIVSVVSYRLSEDHESKFLSAVQNPRDVGNLASSVTFNGGCDSVRMCVYDLTVKTEVQLPVPTYSGPDVDLSDGGRTLVVAPETVNQPIRVVVNLTNSGDVAYESKVIVTYPSVLSWIQVSNVSSLNPGNPDCVMEGQESEQGSDKSRILVYSYDLFLGNIFPSRAWCGFDLRFSFRSLRTSGDIGSIRISISPRAEGDFKNNNDVTITFPVKYLANVLALSLFPEQQVTFMLAEESRDINSVEEIGDERSKVRFDYEVENTGFSRIPSSSISLSFPAFLTPTQGLLYLYEANCSSTEGSATCICNQSSVNPLGLILPGNNSNSNSTVVSSPIPLEQTTYHCNETSRDDYCRHLRCSVVNFSSSSTVRLRTSFRLWAQSLRLFPNKSEVFFNSEFVYSSQDSPFVINSHGEPLLRKLKSTTIARKFEETIHHPTLSLLWLYVIGSVSGLLLLLFFVFILHKKQFFNRIRHAPPMRKVYEWQLPINKLEADKMALDEESSSVANMNEGESDHDYDDVPDNDFAPRR